MYEATMSAQRSKKNPPGPGSTGDMTCRDSKKIFLDPKKTSHAVVCIHPSKIHQKRSSAKKKMEVRIGNVWLFYAQILT
jgi:hypothetical protein